MRNFSHFAFVGLAVAGLQAADAFPPVPAPADVLVQMEQVADWQLAHPGREAVTDWVQGAGYAGMMALAEISTSPRFHDAMVKMGMGSQWKPGARVYHADDTCVGQTYLELFLRDKDPAMIGPLRARFDAILASPPGDDLDFTHPEHNRNWSWCDSLFMAPPAWVRMTAATGEAKYTDYAVANWWKASDFLYDKTEHLFFRDSTYFKKTEANGRKVFWSRGNGWVMGGLVRLLQFLPATHPSRPKFEAQLKEMAAAVLACQQPDGFWRSSLLDPASYPAKETSGTGFYTFALAWGVNQGLLDRPTYGPSALAGWRALLSCVQGDGKLIHVQPVGADPKKFDENATEPYGVGAFLLSGREIFRLGGGGSGSGKHP
jgi:rhamnogalacturonyl hydrolase YesR